MPVNILYLDSISARNPYKQIFEKMQIY